MAEIGKQRRIGGWPHRYGMTSADLTLPPLTSGSTEVGYLAIIENPNLTFLSAGFLGHRALSGSKQLKCQCLPCDEYHAAARHDDDLTVPFSLPNIVATGQVGQSVTDCDSACWAKAVRLSDSAVDTANRMATAIVESSENKGRDELTVLPLQTLTGPVRSAETPLGRPLGYRAYTLSGSATDIGNKPLTLSREKLCNVMHHATLTKAVTSFTGASPGCPCRTISTPTVRLLVPTVNKNERSSQLTLRITSSTINRRCADLGCNQTPRTESCNCADSEVSAKSVQHNGLDDSSAVDRVGVVYFTRGQGHLISRRSSGTSQKLTAACNVCLEPHPSRQFSPSFTTILSAQVLLTAFPVAMPEVGLAGTFLC